MIYTRIHTSIYQLVSTAFCQIIIERRSFSVTNFLRQTNSSFQNTVTRKNYYTRGYKNDKLNFASIYNTRKFYNWTNFFVNLFWPFNILFTFCLHNSYTLAKLKTCFLSNEISLYFDFCSIIISDWFKFISPVNEFIMTQKETFYAHL